MSIAATILVLSIPIIMICVVIITVGTGERPIFRQWRVGRNGQLFQMLKLRTMRAGEGSITLRDDERVTRVGRLLSTSRMDELPQLINVILGDMRLIGYRPETVDHQEDFLRGDHCLVCERPGLTSPASILFKRERDLLALASDPVEFYTERVLPAKLRIDAAYELERSAASDLRILWRTILSPILTQRALTIDDLADSVALAHEAKLLRRGCNVQ